jgi:hypothetical protein
MAYGIRKGLEDVAHELKGIRNILNSMWHSRYKNGEAESLSPEAYADEYISTEECARRLSVSDQTIRNWIAVGKKNADKGWKEGIHYVNVNPGVGMKASIRIPWNSLVESFSRNRKTNQDDFWVGYKKYQRVSLTDME